MSYALGVNVRLHNRNPNTVGKIIYYFVKETGNYTIKRKYKGDTMFICTAPEQECIDKLKALENFYNITAFNI